MWNDFNSEDFSSETEEITNKDKFNNVLAYVPFLNVFLLFTENKNTKNQDKRYTRQWITLFLLYIVGFVILSILSFKLSFIYTAIYIVMVVFFATKAYNGMYVEVDFIEKIIEQFQPKQEEKKEDTKQEDPLK